MSAQPPQPLHHLDTGPRDATPVVLLHAFPLSLRMWSPQLDALGANHRLVACDLRGFGKSPLGDGPGMIEHFVDDVVALLGHLGADKAIVCGLSMGGYVALRLAEREPSRVAGLVLADTRAEADGNDAKVKRAAAITAIERDGVPAFAREFVKTAFADDTLRRKRPIIDAALRLIEENAPASLRAALVALAARTDTTAALPKITVPTLVLVGRDDALTPPSAAHALAEKIPRAELHVLPGAAHMSNLEAEEEFNAHLAAFLEKFPETTCR